jgi:hypothetical protein
MVRTIEELLGLPSMNQHDKLAAAMTDAFADRADLSPFNFVPNQIPLDALNPVAVASLQRAWQTEVARYFPNGPHQVADIADPNLLDHAIWYATTKFTKPFPGEARLLYPTQLRAAGRQDLK